MMKKGFKIELSNLMYFNTQRSKQIIKYQTSYNNGKKTISGTHTRE